MKRYITEAIGTFALVFAGCGAMEKGIMTGCAVGGTIALEALFGGPISGALMNPARSLAPAIASWNPGRL